jgi:large subunit ribosomal protein L32
MAVPKRKTSKSRRNMRHRMNSKLAMPAMAKCQNCFHPIKPHFICNACGYYGKKLVMDVK